MNTPGYDPSMEALPVPRVKRRMLDDLNAPLAQTDSSLMGPGGMPSSGNTGVAGGRMPALQGSPMPQRGRGLPGMAEGAVGVGQQMLPAGTPATKPQGGAAPFTFNNLSVSDILKRYPSTPAGLQQAFAENPELAAVSQIGGSKGDKILDPNTGRMIDVILAAGEGGKGWQWLDDVPGQGGGGAQADPNAGSAMRGMDPAAASIIDQIRQQMLALMGSGG